MSHLDSISDNSGQRPTNPSEGTICRLSQETEKYKSAKEAIGKAFDDQKLEEHDFSKRKLGVLYIEIMNGYADQASQFPGGIHGLQVVLKNLYPKLDIPLDNTFGPKTIRALVHFQSANNLNDEYGTIGCNTIAKLTESTKLKSSEPLPYDKKLSPLQGRKPSEIDVPKTSIDQSLSSLLSQSRGVLTKEIKMFFYKHADNTSPQYLQSFLTSLSPQGIKDLGWGKSEKLKKILKRLQDMAISTKSMTEIISSYISKLDANSKDEEYGLEPDNKNRRAKEREIHKRYKDLTENLNKYYKITPEQLFSKLFIHESGGDAKTSTAQLFAASGTGSLGVTQAVSATFNNSILPESFNPFVPEQAIPGALSFFLLENYTTSNHAIAIRKAKIYAQGHKDGHKIIQDAINGKYDIIVALDRYNKGNAGSELNSLAGMLGEQKGVTVHGNPLNYAQKVMQT